MRLLQAWQVWVTPGAGPRPSRTRISLTSCHLSATPHSLTLSGKNARVRTVGSARRRELQLRRRVLHRMDTHTQALTHTRRCCCTHGLSSQLNKSPFSLESLFQFLRNFYFFFLACLSPRTWLRVDANSANRRNIPSAPLGLALKVSTLSKCH